MTGMKTADDVLAHFGVKGMRWGVRKPRGDRDAIFRRRAKEQQEVQVKATPGRSVRTAGGKYTPPSDDAIRVAKAKQVARKSSTDALSNKELQDVVSRMNLEKQYRQLSGEQMGLGRSYVQKLLSDTGDDQVDAVAGFVGEMTGSKVAGAAAGVTTGVGVEVVKAAMGVKPQQQSKKKKKNDE